MTPRRTRTAPAHRGRLSQTSADRRVWIDLQQCPRSFLGVKGHYKQAEEVAARVSARAAESIKGEAQEGAAHGNPRRPRG